MGGGAKGPLTFSADCGAVAAWEGASTQPEASAPARCLLSLAGDVVVVTPGVLPCDVVLVRGEAIVDENMLTGEAVPVRKVAYSPAVDGVHYSPDVQKACTLYGGTSVAQVCGLRKMACSASCSLSASLL